MVCLHRASSARLSVASTLWKHNEAGAGACVVPGVGTWAGARGRERTRSAGSEDFVAFCEPISTMRPFGFRIHWACNKVQFHVFNCDSVCSSHRESIATITNSMAFWFKWMLPHLFSSCHSALVCACVCFCVFTTVFKLILIVWFRVPLSFAGAPNLLISSALVNSSKN